MLSRFLDPPAAGGQTACWSASPGMLSPMANILLVADTPWVENQTLAALGGEHEIVHVTDPTQVLDTAAESDPDLAIVDLQVGSMGGMAITRTLKDGAMAGDIDDVPILLLLDRSADSFLAKRAGADAWLVKPFNPQDLKLAVQELIGATRA